MNRLYSAACVAAFLLLLCPSGLSQVLPKREFRGVWIATVANIDWPASPGTSVQAQKDLLVSILDKVASAGFNAVVLQVRPECDALYQSPYEPWSYWLSGYQGSAPVPFYDPLAFAVEEAHVRGLEIHAWFNPYRAVQVVGRYPADPGHVSVTHPEWILTIGTLKMLDPGLQQVRDYVTRVIADVARRYDVDGVHMDDYFYSSGITNQDAATFAAYPRGFVSLGDWRRDNVNLLIHQISDSVHAIKSWMKFGMSPAGIWKNGVPTNTSGQDNYSVIYCDAVAWLQGQYIDYIAPQLYWRFGGNQDYGLLQTWWSSQRNGRHFYPGLATYRIGEAAFGGASMIADQIRYNRSTGNSQGSIQFTANYITSGNPGGITDTLRNNLYRSPALLPVMAWKDSVPPYMPRNIRLDNIAGGPAAIRWDLPLTAPDGDSASRYVVYRLDHHPVAAELADPNSILAIAGQRSFVPPAPPTPAGPYYFVVTALDRNFNESDTSNVVILGPPPVPVLSLPLPGAADAPESVYVAWRSSPGASSYHLQLGTDPDFATGLLVNDPSIVDTSRVVRALAGQTKYYWRVRASSGGGTSSFAAPSDFTTGFPLSPVLVFPANVQPDLPVSVVLRWNPSPSATPVTYHLQFAKSSDFASPVLDSSGISDTTLGVTGLQYLTIYFWRVRGSNAIGTSGWSTTFRFRTVQMTSVTEDVETPTVFSLEQNFPNPFNPTTTIRYQIPVGGKVRLVIFDLIGREVDTLVNEHQEPGTYLVTWNAERCSSGVYFVRLVSGSYVSTKRMILVK